jgi:hypothetical protein
MERDPDHWFSDHALVLVFDDLYGKRPFGRHRPLCFSPHFWRYPDGPLLRFSYPRTSPVADRSDCA